MINFGKYDRKCKFFSLGTTSDGYGGNIPQRILLLDTFCRAVQMSGNSNIEVAQLGLPKTYQIGIMYRTGFNPGVNAIVEYDGFDHTIKAVVLNEERQRKEWILTLVRSDVRHFYAELNSELNIEI
jgi:SPP1 family predicted phage head-tail adaptor